jgi:hypothetical protein
MKNYKVKMLFEGVSELLNYCYKQNIKNIVLTTRLNQNLILLKDATEIIDKCVSQELKDLEKKAWEALELKKKEMIEAKESIDNLNFFDALKLLSEEEREKHTELMKEYEKDMDKEYVIKLILIDVEDLKNTSIDPRYSPLLAELITK